MNKHIGKTEIYKARFVGLFFLLAFLAYGLGQHFFESEYAPEKYIGSLLIVLNSVLVLFIGVLLKKTLQPHNRLVGTIYLFTRIFEAITLASIVLNLFPFFQIPGDYAYFLAMLVLGIGSIPMCLILYKYKISPFWLAWWGVVGYSIFALGFLMEFFNMQWSMYFLLPGGLWEITFAIWLITKKQNTISKT